MYGDGSARAACIEVRQDANPAIIRIQMMAVFVGECKEGYVGISLTWFHMYGSRRSCFENEDWFLAYIGGRLRIKTMTLILVS